MATQAIVARGSVRRLLWPNVNVLGRRKEKR